MKKTIIASLLVCVMASCSTDEIDVFDSHNYLSFAAPEMSYTFAFENDDVTSHDYNIAVKYAGRYNDHAATFTIEAVPDKSTAVEGTHYIIPAGQEQAIPANTNTGNALVRLLRTPEMKDESMTLTLVVKADANFLPGDVDTVRVQITDRIIKPDWWTYTPYDRFVGYYGELKFRLFLEFMGVIDGTNPFEADEYIYYTDRGTGNFIYKEYKEWEIKPKIMEFRQWLYKEKNNPTDVDGTPVVETLGSF